MRFSALLRTAFQMRVSSDVPRRSRTLRSESDCTSDLFEPKNQPETRVVSRTVVAMALAPMPLVAAWPASPGALEGRPVAAGATGSAWRVTNWSTASRYMFDTAS